MIKITESDVEISSAIPVTDTVLELSINGETYYYDVSGSGNDAEYISNKVNGIRKHSHGRALQWLLHIPGIVETHDTSADFVDTGYNIPDEEYEEQDRGDSVKKTYIVTATLIDSRDNPSYLSVTIDADYPQEARTIAMSSFKKKYPRSVIRDIRVKQEI